jgi:hypothetical protein
MRFIHDFTSTAAAALLALALIAAGCDNDKGTTQTPSTPAPAAEPKATAEQPKAAPVTPLIKTAQLADWCPEHGVPESVCTRCNESLVAGFKEKGDWDEEHGLPKSQCFKCDSSLQAKFAAAYKEKYGKEPPPMSEEGGDEHDHEHEDEKEERESKES